MEENFDIYARMEEYKNLVIEFGKACDDRADALAVLKAEEIHARRKDILEHVRSLEVGNAALEADNAEMAGDLSHLYDKLKDYEALKSKVERLRWHYPERGELPDEGVAIIAENADAEYEKLYYHSESKYYHGGNHSWVVSSDFIKRWRYIEP